MSDALRLIVAIALVTYAMRLAGFWLGRRSLSPAISRFVTYVPVAAFAALVAIGLESGEGTVSLRLIGAAITGLVMLRWPKLWLGLTAGIAAFWLARVTLA